MPQQHPVDQLLISSLSSMSLYARALIRDVDTAEGIVQEACRRILERRDQLLTVDVRSYAMRVVQNLANDYYNERRHDDVDDMDIEDSENPEADASRLAMFDVIGKLDRTCRELLTLVGMGYKQREISILLRQVIGTIGSSISRCREKLERLAEVRHG